MNRHYYGSLHNNGHVLIALCHDPDMKYNEDQAVMGDTATAMRDTIFYNWHTFINDLFLLHKDKLPPYTNDELNFNGIEVSKVELADEKGNFVDELKTFWQKSVIDLENGLDFSAPGTLLARLTHLNYETFSYKLVD